MPSVPLSGNAGLSGTLADPVITLYDASGQALATNDNWQAGANADQIAADGLAPSDPAEAALRTTLEPGAYTAVVTGKNTTQGIGLVEVYDLSPASNSRLANISTRGIVGTESDQLIAGFIVGAVDSSTVVVRSLGPSLGAAGIDDPLKDPSFTVYDQNGFALATNDNWRDDSSALDLEQDKIAPPDDAEAATILHFRLAPIPLSQPAPMVEPESAWLRCTILNNRPLPEDSSRIDRRSVQAQLPL